MKSKSAFVLFFAFVCGLSLFSASSSYAEEWLAGDLHTHSKFSDGDSPVGAIISRAEELGLQYLSITDHDITQIGTPRQWRTQQHVSEKLTLLYGMGL